VLLKTFYGGRNSHVLPGAKKSRQAYRQDYTKATKTSKPIGMAYDKTAILPLISDTKPLGAAAEKR